MKKFIVVLSLVCSFGAMAESNYKCFGTEPFWAMSITQDKLAFGLFDDDTVTEDILSRETAQGTSQDFAFVVTTKSASATIIAGECSDGMSDNIYSHHVVYKNASSTLYGCCNQTSK